MKEFALFLSLLVLPVAMAQGTAPSPAPKSPAKYDQDVKSIDSVIKALYDVISGPAGQQRDWDRMKNLFTSDGTMAYVAYTRGGELRHVEIDPDKYKSYADPYFKKQSFFEREVSRKTEQFAHMATVFSTYESRYKPEDKKPFERGINALQLITDGKRWFIRTILWEGESDQFKLPSKYLK